MLTLLCSANQPNDKADYKNCSKNTAAVIHRILLKSHIGPRSLETGFFHLGDPTLLPVIPIKIPGALAPGER
jgi:hypothetical protein